MEFYKKCRLLCTPKLKGKSSWWMLWNMINLMILYESVSPIRHQVIIWTNDNILEIGPLGTNFSKILTIIQQFSYKKLIWKNCLQNVEGHLYILSSSSLIQNINFTNTCYAFLGLHVWYGRIIIFCRSINIASGKADHHFHWYCSVYDACHWHIILWHYGSIRLFGYCIIIINIIED